MNKWDYIKLISKNGSPYGGNGGVLDLLQWCGKPNTAAVSLDEAKAFWEKFIMVRCEYRGGPAPCADDTRGDADGSK